MFQVRCRGGGPRVGLGTGLVAALLFAVIAGAQLLPPEKQVGAVGRVPGALRFDDPPHAGFDDVHQHQVVRHELRITNHGQLTVDIFETASITPGGTVTVAPSVLAPGASAVVRVQQDVGAALGRTAFRYALISDEPGVSRYRFSLSGFVESAYDPELPRLDFGRVDRDAGGTASCELASREVDRLELQAVGGLPPSASYAIERAGMLEEGVRLIARLAPGAPLGVLAGELRLTTNVVSQPVLTVPYHAVVFGDVVPSEHPIAFGLVQVGETVTRRVRLTSRSGRELRVVAISDSAGAARTHAAPCAEGGPQDCWLLDISLALATPQRFSGTLQVTLAGDAEPIPLVYSGVAVSPGTVVRDLGTFGAPPGSGETVQ